MFVTFSNGELIIISIIICIHIKTCKKQYMT